MLLQSPSIVTPGEVLDPGWVETHGRHVTGVGKGRAAGGNVIALPEGILAPGLIDAQINGGFGVDFADGPDEDWIEILRRLPATGATSIVPTIITAPLNEMVIAVDSYRERLPRLRAQPGLTRTLGLHLEGPFLSEKRCGAHNPELLRDPDDNAVAALAAVADSIAYLTLAPERHGALDAIRRLTDAGIRVSIGHSDATEGIVSEAATAGATLVTHLYNAQRPFAHRDPGVVGAGLINPRLTLGLIADLHHVAPTAIRLAFTAAPGRIALVTDAIAALGMPAGTYVLGGEPVDVNNGHPPWRPDGTIAGSTLQMDTAIANTVACGVSLSDAVAAATITPADALGHIDLGRLAPGCVADLVWLSDDLTTLATWMDGRLAFCHNEFQDLLGAGGG